MAIHSHTTETRHDLVLGKVFAAAFGSFLGLALLKFGTPSVLDKFVTLPGNGYEWMLFVWPLRIAYGVAIATAMLALPVFRWKSGIPIWLLAMPLIWLAWQTISSAHTIDPELSRGVIAHFGICTGCFLLGAFCLSGASIRPFFLFPLLVAFGLMLWVGVNQHFGELEATRKYFWAEIYPKLGNVPPEYIKKMQSDRIFATVFYPNALAGALLLILPPLLSWIGAARDQFTFGARSFLCGALSVASMACLYWSGSKGGWLLALATGLVALLHLEISKRLKVGLICGMLACGGVGFAWKYAAFFQRGATSVAARFDYWHAAWGIAKANPFFGSGPGTFGVVYLAVKKPGSEMARLAHNDYLQQASDSGFPGMVAYLAFIGGILFVGYRGLDWKKTPVGCGVWLGLGAWAIQSSFEFTLYVPALGWIAFAFAGWLVGNLPKTIRQDPLLNGSIPLR